MAKITFFLSSSKDAGFNFELTSSKNGEERQLCNRWPDTHNNDFQLQQAIGKAILSALTSKHDYGNTVQVVIELPICSIDVPLILI